MKAISSISLFLALVLFIGCDTPTEAIEDESRDGPEMSLTVEERSILDQEIAGHRRRFSISRAPVMTIGDDTRVGRSRMIRYRRGIIASIRTSELEPGTATSLWMVVFNRPEFCSDGECGSNDLSNPDVRADLLWVDGKIIGDNGRANYFVHKREGDTEGSIADPLLGQPEYGIEEADKTEFHFVVRTHGPVIEGFEYEMTHTFNGCCQLNGLPDDPRLGPVGPNICSNVQAAIHFPRMRRDSRLQ